MEEVTSFALQAITWFIMQYRYQLVGINATLWRGCASLHRPLWDAGKLCEVVRSSSVEAAGTYRSEA